MEKYRKIATLGSNTSTSSNNANNFDPSLDTLPSSTEIEEPLIRVEEDKIVFDDEFKFEDAKRKLRTVFCTADQTNLPR